MASYDGTQQWQHIYFPKVGRHPNPPKHSTPQWHPTMAPPMAPRPLPRSWFVTLPPPPTIAHYIGTLRWDPAMATRPLHPAMAPWCHVQSTKVVRRPPPLLEVRTPIAIAIWGKTTKRLTNWPNIATKFAKRGTHKSLLLLNWSSWHHAASAMQWTEFACNTQSSTSPEESSARLPAGLRPHRCLWCNRESTWSDQKWTVGIKGRQSIAVPLASHICMSYHLQLSISHV